MINSRKNAWKINVKKIEKRKSSWVSLKNPLTSFFENSEINICVSCLEKLVYLKDLLELEMNQPWAENLPNKANNNNLLELQIEKSVVKLVKIPPSFFSKIAGTIGSGISDEIARNVPESIPEQISGQTPRRNSVFFLEKSEEKTPEEPVEQSLKVSP